MMRTMSGSNDGMNATLDHRSHRSASALRNEKGNVRRKAPEIKNGRKSVSANAHTSGSASGCESANGNPNANGTGNGLTLVRKGERTLTGIEPSHQVRRASVLRTGMAADGSHGGQTHHAVDMTEHGTSVPSSVTGTDVVSAHPYGLGTHGDGQWVGSASAPPRGDSPLHGEATAMQPALGHSHATQQRVEAQAGAGCG